MSNLSNFNYTLSGLKEGPKLVFLHGLMGSAANWRRIRPAFEQGYQVLTYDQRGHGRSFQPKTGYAPDDFADDLKNILDELDWAEPIYLVGHSMGGRNALNFTHRFCERVKALVIEDIAPNGNLDNLERMKFLVNVVPVPFENKAAARAFFKGPFQEAIGPGKSADVLAQYFYTNITTNDQGQAIWRFYREGIIESVVQGRAQDRWDEIQGLKKPTLVIRGENSDELTVEHFEKMQSLNSNVNGVEIKNAGHWVHSDQPEEFIQVIKGFFSQI